MLEAHQKNRRRKMTKTLPARSWLQAISKWNRKVISSRNLSCKMCLRLSMRLRSWWVQVKRKPRRRRSLTTLMRVTAAVKTATTLTTTLPMTTLKAFPSVATGTERLKKMPVFLRISKPCRKVDLFQMMSQIVYKMLSEYRTQRHIWI